jgi:pteridine reductase
MKQQPPVVLITGAARRIGAAVARQVHAGGWNVVLHYRASGADARHVAHELNAARADSAHCLRANLLNLGQLQRVVEQSQARWGRLDALVNNASSYFRTPLKELSEAQFEDLVGTNFRAPLFLCQAFAAASAGAGAIVNVADTHVTRPGIGFSAYIAAKSALVSLTEALALELAPRIRVNAVAPGHILWAAQPQMDAAQQQAELRRVPLQRLGQPEEVARAVAWLLSADAAYVTGAVLPVDGGLRLA